MNLSAVDRLAILEVIIRADEAASRRDADGYVALFTQDAVLDGAQGRHAGQSDTACGDIGARYQQSACRGQAPWPVLKRKSWQDR